jgi:hypothetical protein
MPDERKIQGTKISSDELVNLLNKWRSSGSEIQLIIKFPEISTHLTVTIDEFKFPTVTVLPGGVEQSDRIYVHLSGCVLERFEGSDGVGTLVRASWLSWKDRELVLAETI